MRIALLGAAVAAMLTGAAATAADVHDLRWMSGRWEAVAGDGWTEEQWSAPRGGVMLGFSRSGRPDSVAEYEFLRLQAGEGGVPTYLPRRAAARPWPSGSPLRTSAAQRSKTPPMTFRSASIIGAEATSWLRRSLPAMAAMR